MSGHSKWSTIKRQKGIEDKKRSNAFTKLSRAISIAVRESGGITDPAMNFKLRLAVEKAKAENMPKLNIERAIASGAGGNGSAEVFTALYEGYGPGGVAVLVESVTDNKQRAFQDIRQIFDKSGATLGQPGSVNYLFERVGEIIVVLGEGKEELMLEIMEIAGIVDLLDMVEYVVIYTDHSALAEVKDSLELKGLVVKDAGLIYKPKENFPITEEQEGKLRNFVDKLEESDEVQNVFVNYEL